MSGAPAVWSRNKARFIEEYLAAFQQVTKSGVLIDGFSGPQRVDDLQLWTAKRVLEMRPPWLQRFFLCELEDAKVSMLRDLQRTHNRNPSSRRVSVFAGDFNQSIDVILQANRVKRRTPTFALLDMRTAECKWSTVEKIARHKRFGMKVEILYFLATGWLPRALSKKDEDDADAWWGRPDWRELRRGSHVTWAAALADRFQKDYGYRFAHPWPIHAGDDSPRVFYYLVHATDHPAAPGLMRKAYRTACGGRAGTLADDQSAFPF